MQVPSKVSELVQSSGNNFHAKVARWLCANEWHVVVSPYYMDQTQNKAREIDLIAEKSWPVKDTRTFTVGNVVVRLYVECKFVASQSVFWFADKDREHARKLVWSSGPFPTGNNSHTEEHHYLAHSPKVAKLFATSANKAQESEPFYKALNQVLNAMISMSGRPVSIPDLKKYREMPCPVLEFPIVVCNAFEHLYSVDFLAESSPVSIKENFQMEVRYAYIDRQNVQRDDYFLLDFVEFEQLEKFTQAINHDADIAASFIALL